MNEYIAVDWGSTQLRSWHIRDGECVKTQALQLGITQLQGTTPQAVFAQHIGVEKLPVVMAGMVGSDAGWVPVPYLPCPVALTDLRQQLFAVADQVWIVPGIKLTRHGEFNVMRGEETQLLGAMQLAPATCYVMPGTHCKWVQTDAGVVNHFTTTMTGELHHLLMTQSLIGKGLPAQQTDEEAFTYGLVKGSADPTLIARLFEARAARVLGALPASSVSDFLSGLLIGSEVRTLGSGLNRVTLVGNQALAARYQQAFTGLGINVAICDGDQAFLQGIRELVNG